MRKSWYIARQLQKSMGGQFILVLLAVLITSFCVQYTFALPIDRLVRYARYGGAVLDRAAVLNVNSSLYWRWSDGFLSPGQGDYAEARAVLDELADVAYSGCDMLTTGEGFRLYTYIYSAAMVKNVRLPGNLSEKLLEAQQSHPGHAAILLDERLKERFQEGDELTCSRRHGESGAAVCVAGFIDRNYRGFFSTSGGSVPSITHLIDDTQHDEYTAVLLEHPSSSISATDYPQTTLLMFPKDSQTLDGQLNRWREEVAACGLGEIVTWREMAARDILMQIVGEDNVLGLMSLWCLILLLIGLKGFTANIADRLEQQIVVYRISGMTEHMCFRSILWAYGLPVAGVILLTQLLAMALFTGMIDWRIWPLYLMVSILLSLSVVLPVVRSTMRACRGLRFQLREAEGGKLE